ncbi:unnamed protein product [Dibothriocephalus latus]|uniref:Uncharacterized protein n=1 Tax=Dibothriocephalus latus TaxID=60516 RepID=A0A3P6UJV1_DIBLA|nr:unnamed protein product [Dibothriocephalus latus]
MLYNNGLREIQMHGSPDMFSILQSRDNSPHSQSSLLLLALHSNAPSDKAPVERFAASSRSSEGRGATNSAPLYRRSSQTTRDHIPTQQANMRGTEARPITVISYHSPDAGRTPSDNATGAELSRPSIPPELEQTTRPPPAGSLRQQGDNYVIEISDSD